MTKISRFADPGDLLNKAKFVYKHADGTVVRDAKILEWIDLLRIPPAWINVSINYDATSKQTCTGYDPAGRMQALYSEQHKKRARQQKYCDLIKFGETLPRILTDIKSALSSTRFTKIKVTALVLRIVACCSFRLGTLMYEAQNDSYGITTIRTSHVRFTPETAHIEFVGKKGVINTCQVGGDTCEVLRQLVLAKKPDDHVMMYQVGGTWEHLRHTDVNNWLKAYGETFTSKDFRTFHSNQTVIELLLAHDPNPLKPSARKKIMNDAIKQVSDIVHNTPAVCRKDYIDPEILECYMLHPVRYRKMFITPGNTARVMFINWLKLKCLKS